LFDKIKEKGISLLIKVPLDSGWLTGKYDENSIFTGIRARWDIDTIKQRANLVKKLKGIVDDNVLTKYAIAFILSHDAVTSIITGVKSLDQLNENISYESFSINDKVIKKFYELYQNEIIKKPLKW
jgi:aryl-alcohol dehydrogenase-like predicted oxidoreductase